MTLRPTLDWLILKSNSKLIQLKSIKAGAVSFCLQETKALPLQLTCAIISQSNDLRSVKIHPRTGSVVVAMQGCLAMGIKNQL